VSAPLGGAPPPPPDAYFEAAAKKFIEDAGELLRGTPTVAAEIRRGHAGQCLVESSQDASLLVVGSRGRGAVASAVLGSISAYCASHAHVPVAIVPESTEPARQAERIVVGIDGSVNSEAALSWAIDHSGPDTAIMAIASWAPPMSYDGAILSEIDGLDDRYREMLHATIDRVRAAHPHGASRTIQAEVVMGDSRSVLRSAEADLVVVGARGHKGLEYLLMGSTASSLVHDPVTPTVVVPSVEE
jgi:nucleotide-binding universal stress UspA family protein